jgi:hypothetical protein
LRKNVSEEASMPLFSKSDEDKAAKAAAKEAKRAVKDAEEFARSPQGRARAAFERGDALFQCAFDLQRTHAYVGMVTGGQTYYGPSNDPSEILNSIASEGWDLVNASVAFVETGSESRDRLLASGQNVATRGTVMGYYVFRRRPA